MFEKSLSHISEYLADDAAVAAAKADFMKYFDARKAGIPATPGALEPIQYAAVAAPALYSNAIYNYAAYPYTYRSPGITKPRNSTGARGPVYTFLTKPVTVAAPAVTKVEAAPAVATIAVAPAVAAYHAAPVVAAPVATGYAQVSPSASLTTYSDANPTDD